jgi:hypothetical protein
MDGTSKQDTEHVQNWLNKLKDSQDRKKDDKIRRYNDVVSRLIILLIGVCIVCVIVIAALIIQNEGQKKTYDQMVIANQTTFINGQRENYTTFINDQNVIRGLQSQIDIYRTTDVLYHVSISDYRIPNLVMISYNKSQLTLHFADGTTESSEFSTLGFDT